MGKKTSLILVVIVGLLFLGYRFSMNEREAVALQADTMERAITPVTITRAKLSDPTDSITLPGNIVGWNEAPIYARVTGYVKEWHKDYGHAVKKRRGPRRNYHAGSRCRIPTGRCGSAIRTRQECTGRPDRQTLCGDAAKSSAFRTSDFGAGCRGESPGGKSRGSGAKGQEH